MASMLRGLCGGKWDEDAHSRPGAWAGYGHIVLSLSSALLPPLPRRASKFTRCAAGRQGCICQHCTEVLRTLFLQ